MNLLHDFSHSLAWGEPRNFGSLTLTPIHQQLTLENDYLSLDQALEFGVAEIQEVSESGSVRQVSINNFSDNYLILFDGDALKGAKQNRILDQTVVIPPKTSSTIPVNCVEQGRWAHQSRQFASADFKAPPSMKRAKTNLKKMGMENRVQSEVWNCVSELSESLHERSSSGDLWEVMSKAEIRSEGLTEYLRDMDCEGFLVQGSGPAFVEVFPRKADCKTWSLKSYKGWQADSYRAKGFPIYTRDTIVEMMQSSQWSRAQNVGDEASYQSSDQHDGRLTYHEGKLLHVYWSMAN